MRNIWLFLAAITLITFAVAGLMLLSDARHHGMYRTYRKASYSSVGESIYYAGMGSNERAIPYTGGAHWMRTMGERGCINCHGIDGRGGFPLMMTSTVAPDVTYESLTSEVHYHDGESEVHEGKYTDENIKRAIIQGLNPSGKKLSPIMPRWSMTEEESSEILEYLKKLQVL